MKHIKNDWLLKDSCLVNGQWVKSATGRSIEVKNPANGQTVGHVPSLDTDEVKAAIGHAHDAFRLWRQTTGHERAHILMQWYGLIMEHVDDLAAIITAEQGKPLAEAKGELRYAASFVEWFAAEAKRIEGDVLSSPYRQQRILTLRQPVGVCAAITPWNFPAAMITRKAAPALAAGCSMVVRPAELTPLTALALGALAHKAGIPQGVLQIITGEAEDIGATLTADERVMKLSFTGSTRVGRLLMEQCAPTVKRLSLELGGNAPFIVFDDADLDAAVEGAVATKFRNAGQVCVCVNRIYVQSGIYDRFVEKLAEKVKGLKTGPGDEPDTMVGPLISAAAIDKVESHIQDALSKGAELRVGGSRHPLGGQFFEPTVIANVTQQMKVAREETFAPLAPVFRFETEEEVLGYANDTIFGLAAYFYTNDARRVWRMSEGLEYGMVGHNTGAISNEVMPFGGVKQSGIGREGSRYGIEEYQELKSVVLDIG